MPVFERLSFLLSIRVFRTSCSYSNSYYANCQEENSGFTNLFL
nr:MAG TPA: hypothetical protein [Caudoviricetes sp.]